MRPRPGDLHMGIIRNNRLNYSGYFWLYNCTRLYDGGNDAGIDWILRGGIWRSAFPGIHTGIHTEFTQKNQRLCPQETEVWWISFLWWIPFAKHHKYRLTTTIKAHMHAKCAAMLLSCIVFLHGFVLKYGTPQSTG